RQVLAEAPTRFCVVPRREFYFGESYFEATGHSRGRAIFRALQRLLSALEGSRDFSALVPPAASPRAPPGTVTKRRPRKIQLKFSCCSFDGSGERSAIAEGLPQPSGLGNPSESRNRDRSRHRPRTDCRGEPDQHSRTIPTVAAPRTARTHYSGRRSG